MDYTNDISLPTTAKTTETFSATSAMMNMSMYYNSLNSIFTTVYIPYDFHVWQPGRLISTFILAISDSENNCNDFPPSI